MYKDELKRQVEEQRARRASEKKKKEEMDQMDEMRIRKELSELN